MIRIVRGISKLLYKCIFHNFGLVQSAAEIFLHTTLPNQFKIFEIEAPCTSLKLSKIYSKGNFDMPNYSRESA